MYKDTQKPEIRCAHCGRKIAEGFALDLTIKCPRCGVFNSLRATRPDSAPHDGPKDDICGLTMKTHG